MDKITGATFPCTFISRPNSILHVLTFKLNHYENPCV